MDSEASSSGGEDQPNPFHVPTDPRNGTTIDSKPSDSNESREITSTAQATNDQIDGGTDSKNQSDLALNSVPNPFSESPGDKPPPLPPKINSEYHELIFPKRGRVLTSTQLLIRFLIGLSNLTFFVGSLSGVIVFLYQRYLFPQLQVATKRLLSLKLTTLKSYDSLVELLKSLCHSNPELYKATAKCIFNRINNLKKTDEKKEIQNDEDHKFSKKLKEGKTRGSEEGNLNDNSQFEEGDNPSSLLEEEDNARNSENSEKVRSDLSKPINENLERLILAIRRREKSKTEDVKNPKFYERPAETLADSIKNFRFTVYRSNHQSNSNFHQFKNSHLRKFSPDNSDQESQEERDRGIEKRKNKVEEGKDHGKVLNEFKKEVRSLKGMLLNRRNFSSRKN